MIKLSVIIPVYNTEQFLHKCLSSCVDQLEDGVEIIIVNDGSPDNSQSIIDYYCSKFSSVRAITQQNQGLSVARNTGLESAKGDYVWFVDSDDWIKPGAFHEILQHISDGKDLDLLTIRRVGCANEKINNFHGIISGKQLLLSENFEHGAVFYIYKRSFLNEHLLRFKPGIYHEDTEFTPRLLYYAERCGSIDIPLYNVTINTNSITRTGNPKKSYDLIVVVRSLWNFRNRVVEEQDVQRVFAKVTSVALNNAFANIVKSDNGQQRTFEEHMYENKDLYRVLSFGLLKNKIEYVLFSIMPRGPVRIYKILSRLR